MALKGLVIRQPWIGMILGGEKTWEMRSTVCRHRGPVALIEQGTGTIVGLADLVDDLAPLDEAGLRATHDRHRIPPEQIEAALSNRWVRPWVLANVRPLAQPVRYQHRSGAVTWVQLSPEEEAAVRNAAAGGALVSSGTAAGGIRASDRIAAGHLLGELAGDPAIGPIPAGARTVLRRHGNQLHIDVEWDDGEPEPPVLTVGWRPWVQLVGTLAVAGVPLCMIGFMLHFFFGMLSASISALAAFRWWVALAICALVALVCGQGRLLAQMFDDIDSAGRKQRPGKGRSRPARPRRR